MNNRLREYKSNPLAFIENLTIPAVNGECRFGDCMADFQRERFQQVIPSLVQVAKGEKPTVPRFWWEATKGSSKDSDLACLILWLIAASNRSLTIQAGAGDREQSDELRRAARDILRLNPWLGQIIEIQSFAIVRKSTQSECNIIPADARGSHGSRPDVVLVNELSHIGNSEFPATLFDNLSKMPRGLGIIATNAGFKPSWQWDWRQNAIESSRWKTNIYSQPAPWLEREELKEAEKRNSKARYKRLFKGQWVSQTGDALDSQDISNCITHRKGMSGREKGWTFAAGLDIGISKHASALVIVGKHTGFYNETEKPRILSSTMEAAVDLGIFEPPPAEYEIETEAPTHRLRLASVQTWKPTTGRVSLEAVRVACIRACERYNLAGIACDPHQAAHLVELLQRDNIPIIETPQTVPSLHAQAVSLLESIQQRTLELYHDADLIEDLKQLQILDRGERVRLVSPETKEGETGTGHGDSVSALSFATNLAKNSVKSGFSQNTSQRTLVYE